MAIATRSSSAQHAASHQAPTAPRPARAARQDSALGNQALQELAGHGMLRAKLAVGAGGDPAEAAADRMADAALAGKPAPCSCGPGQPPCPSCQAGSQAALRRKPRSHDQVKSSPRLALGHERPLGARERGFFEARYQADLSDVRVHDNAAAAASADSLNARAFSLGSRIAFGAGEYRPDSDDGKRLLGHELAHVVLGHGGVRRQEKAEPAVAPPAVKTETDEESIVFMGRTIKTNKESVREALTEALAAGGKGMVAALRMKLENTLPHKFCNPMLGSCRDVAAQGPAVTALGESTVRKLLPMIDEEMKAIEKEHEAFKGVVRAATQLRLQGNMDALDLWSSFIQYEISAPTLQGQVASTVMQKYTMMAFHHPDQALANRALEEMVTTRNVANQRTQAAIVGGEIHGGCAHCHRLTYETNMAYQNETPLITGSNIAEQLQAGSQGPRPWFAENAIGAEPPPPAKAPGIAASPVLSAAVDQAAHVQPYLRQLGPNGYKILPLDDVNALGLPPEKLRSYVLDHIATRRAHFVKALEAAGKSDFDYLIPQVVVQELVQLQNPAVQAITQADIRERAAEARGKAIGLLILAGMSLLLTIFPPTMGLGLALGAVGGILNFSESRNMYQQGVLLEHMIGARNVITPQQEEAALQMKLMGQIGMVMSVIDVGATALTAGFKIVKIVRAAGAIKSVEVEVSGTRVLIEGLDTGAPIATTTGGAGPPTRIILPGGGGGGGGGQGPIIGPGPTPLTGPVPLYLPGKGVNPGVTGLTGAPRESALQGNLILLDELGRPITLKQTQGGKLVAEMDTTLLGESRLVGPSGKPLSGQVPSPWRPLVDANGRPLPFSPREGPVVLDLQAGTPAYGSALAQKQPGLQAFGAEGGNWLLGYQRVNPTRAGDLDLASQIARNSPVWPATPAYRTSLEGMPRALPWEMDPATHLFPQQGPMQMLPNPANPNLGAQFFPATGQGGRLVPRGVGDVAGLTPSAPLPLPGKVDQILLRRPFGLGTANEATSKLMGEQINGMLKPGGFVEFRPTRATDIGPAQIDAIAKAIPGSTTVRVSAADVAAFKATGGFPEGASAIQQDMIRGAAADTAGLGAGEFKYSVRIYAPGP